jgi:hypothetical protein
MSKWKELRPRIAAEVESRISCADRSGGVTVAVGSGTGVGVGGGVGVGVGAAAGSSLSAPGPQGDDQRDYNRDKTYSHDAPRFSRRT